MAAPNPYIGGSAATAENQTPKPKAMLSQKSGRRFTLLPHELLKAAIGFYLTDVEVAVGI